MKLVERTLRREQAEARQAKRAERTDEEQLALLEERGHPHCAEAEKLRARIAVANGED